MRMRVAPDGGFIQNIDTTQGPLEQGPGTPGIVYHAEGPLGGVQELLGAGVPLQVQFRNGGAAVATLPWRMTKNMFWEWRFLLTMLTDVAAPGGNLVVRATAADVVTAVRSTLWTWTEQVADEFTQQPWAIFRIVDGTGWANDRSDVQIEVEGVTDLDIVNSLIDLRLTQYVP
jgi:hypothetical protein